MPGGKGATPGMPIQGYPPPPAGIAFMIAGSIRGAEEGGTGGTGKGKEGGAEGPEGEGTNGTRRPMEITDGSAGIFDSFTKEKGTIGTEELEEEITEGGRETVPEDP